MVRGGFRHLIVIDGGEAAGVLSVRDIVRCWTDDGASCEVPQSPMVARRPRGVARTSTALGRAWVTPARRGRFRRASGGWEEWGLTGPCRPNASDGCD